MSIQWVGYSQFWSPVEPSSLNLYAMPLVEEAVLSVAFDKRYEGKRRLSRQGAINCSSRVALRKALEGVGLNPRWEKFQYPKHPSVLKAPASTSGSGIHLLTQSPSLDRLKEYAPEEALWGVVEEWIEGPQWEIDGFVLEGNIHFFFPLRQHWDRGRIVKYERELFTFGLRNAAADAIRAVGLDNCPFCVEMRLSGGRWIIIELNARLGEDPGLSALIWDMDPLSVIEQTAYKITSLEQRNEGAAKQIEERAA